MYVQRPPTFCASCNFGSWTTRVAGLAYKLQCRTPTEIAAHTYVRAHTHTHTYIHGVLATHTHARVFATTWKKFCHHSQMLFSTLFCLHFGSPGKRGGDVGAYFPTANFSCSKRKVLCVQIIELALVSKNNIITIINCNYSQINYAHRLQISLFPLLTLGCYAFASVSVSGPAHVTHSTPTTTSKSVTTLTTVTTWSVTRPDTIDTYNWRTL